MLQNEDTAKQCFVTEHIDSVFLFKKERELLFPIYSFVSKRLIS